MEPEIRPQPPETPLAHSAADTAKTPEIVAPTPQAPKFQWLRWTFIGDQGPRAGWSILIFCLLFGLFAAAVGFVVGRLHLIDKKAEFTASTMFVSELVSFLAMVGAAAVIALVEQRSSLLAFNLTGPRRIIHFLSGLLAGFAALSALIGALAWGHWLHFGPVALSGAAIFKFGALWGCAFLLVGCVEEGTFRCYLQFTLTRGINFWWALGINAVLCSLPLLVKTKSNGVWGFYAVALLGLLPCLWLHFKKVEGGAFWQAAWVTSSLFGFVHIFNGGENPVGIFAAALIGFVFCVSIRVTGSAWWAIGCHAAWDWAETYFYGAADSGNVATGHYLTTTPAGNALWSGGTDGPEGSLLVLGVILLLLAALLLIYGRKKQKPPALMNSLLERAIG
ncbi:MAG: CPBP family intramembrane glutamic endopeptidase [Terracidiphilus sp.]|jgi:membrane protease YdiL (CAAX protease family)